MSKQLPLEELFHIAHQGGLIGWFRREDDRYCVCFSEEDEEVVYLSVSSRKSLPPSA